MIDTTTPPPSQSPADGPGATIIPAGLDREQEIRASAALAAATALGPAIAAAAAAPFDPDDLGKGRELLVELTEVFTALIRDGSRP